MSKKTQIELFLELAKPDENGVSRWVAKTEFVGKYSDLMFQNDFDARGQRQRLRLDVLAILDDVGGCGLFDLTLIVPCQSSGQALDDDLALLPSRSKRWIRVARTLRRDHSLFRRRFLQACFVCLACFQYVQTVSVDARRGPPARYRDRHRSSR